MKRGMWLTKEYRAWQGMKNRCYNELSQDYKDYGAKGIIVCDRWRYSFENFFEDMGIAPSKEHSLDRFPNRAGNYELDNCRWATKKQQSENRDYCVMIEYKGISLNMTQWSEKFNFPVYHLINAKKREKSLAGVLCKFDKEAVFSKSDWEIDKPFDPSAQLSAEYKGTILSLKTWASVLGIGYKYLHKVIVTKNKSIEYVLSNYKFN